MCGCDSQRGSFLEIRQQDGSGFRAPLHRITRARRAAEHLIERSQTQSVVFEFFTLTAVLRSHIDSNVDRLVHGQQGDRNCASRIETPGLRSRCRQVRSRGSTCCACE